MSNVIEIELLQKREMLHEEILHLQEEIDILSLILKRMHNEYTEVGNSIKKKSAVR